MDLAVSATFFTFPPEPLVRVKFSPAVGGALGRIEAAVGDRAHLFAVPMPAAGAGEGEGDEAAAPEGADRRQVLATVVDPHAHPELFAFCLGLIEADDPKGYLAEARGRLGAEAA